MSKLLAFPSDEATFREVVSAISRCLDPTRRLPGWPFRAPTGFITIYEYDRVVGGCFGSVLEALAAEFSDDGIFILGVEPGASYYRDGYDIYPAFTATASSVEGSYAAGMQHEPGDDPTGALGLSLDVVAIAGSSGAWSVWAQRDWEIGLLLTGVPEGSWLQTDVPWFRRDVELDSIRSPDGWASPLGDEDLATFRRNIRERGTGTP